MMASEFYDRTGIDVVGKPYDIIEELYYDFDGNKDDFCKAFRANKNDLITKTFRQINELLHSLVNGYEKELKEKNQEIELLKENYRILEENYDRDLKWTDKGTLSFMESAQYQRLLESGSDDHFCWHDNPVDFINDECGFEKERIRIIDKIAVYEINRYGRYRTKGWEYRRPVYDATDWNYICFEVIGTGMTYEFVNGMLHAFLGEEYHER